MINQSILQASGLVLTVLTLALFTTETLFLAPFILLSILGCVHLFSIKPVLRGMSCTTLLGLFACIWLPMALSTIDAVNSVRALEKTVAYVLFLPAVFFITRSITTPRALSVLHTCIFVIVCVWIIDGTIQFFAGSNLLGYPYTPPQLKGLFYPKVRMPYLLAVLAPVFFEYLRLHGHKRKWLFLLLIPFGMMLLLGGKRSAWIMFVFSGGGYLVYLYFLNRVMNVKKVLLMAALILAPLILLVVLHPPLNKRIDDSLNVFSADAAVIDKATAHRLDLWRVAINVARQHWINGVGPRGFREVFNEYATEDNFWIASGRPHGSTHPHLFLAEITSETGVIGLTGFLLFYLLLLRLLVQEVRNRRAENVPWLLCPLTAWLPLNAHLAFYGSYWSSVSWWILAVSIGAINRNRRE